MAIAAEVTPRSLYTGYGRMLTIHPAEDEDPGSLFERVCADFENTKIEQDAEGNIRIMTPAGGESGYQNQQLVRLLGNWAEGDGRGIVFDSSTGFILPDGSRLSPDASWAGLNKLQLLNYKQRREFLRIVPDFVVEIKSPSDRRPDLQAKMETYIRNGVQLGWLIDPDKRTVAIYRPGRPVTLLEAPLSLSENDAILPGFVLDLNPIWQGLKF